MSGEDCCQLSVSPSSTAAVVIRHFLDAKNISDDKQHLYSLIAIPAVGSEQSKGMYWVSVAGFSPIQFACRFISNLISKFVKAKIDLAQLCTLSIALV